MSGRHVALEGERIFPACTPSLDDVFSDMAWSLTHDTFTDVVDVDKNPTDGMMGFQLAIYNGLCTIFGVTPGDAKLRRMTKADNRELDAFEASFRAIHNLPANPSIPGGKN